MFTVYVKAYLRLIILTFLLNYLWEMAQSGFYENLVRLPFYAHLWGCLKASLGDVVIAGGTYVATAVFFRNLHWVFSGKWRFPALVWIFLGLLVTIFIELWATSNNIWTYTASMPKIYGVGLTPLFQWLAIPVTLLCISRRTAHGINGNHLEVEV